MYLSRSRCPSISSLLRRSTCPLEPPCDATTRCPVIRGAAGPANQLRMSAADSSHGFRSG
eukprot:CAMPEP_0114175492 /NCGR_PEP_ID=MMETSP0043_2-20121206/36992_1 /TAXON_ID=464988 /ORGANISM="Hemiselmis andersenii, Strain CCMP644" /LENGTH=59 /DNA_ID=CAMNT_0001273747 /DNA_START=65 /DNA_END=240 /DNA_ORIENTATION=-